MSLQSENSSADSCIQEGKNYNQVAEIHRARYKQSVWHIKIVINERVKCMGSEIDECSSEIHHEMGLFYLLSLLCFSIGMTDKSMLSGECLLNLIFH